MNDFKKENRRIQTGKIFEGFNENFAAPYFLYPMTNNLEFELIKNFEQALSLTYIKEKEILSEGEVCFMNSREVRPEFRLNFASIDVLNYIYAVLYSFYSKKNNKIDFPEVPYPMDTSMFWKLAGLGGELRQIHLLEWAHVEKSFTTFPVIGNNLITNITYHDEKAFINKIQYFENVPGIAWELQIGSNRPAQKWLIERKGKQLTVDDILLYQKIIVALKETDRLMKEIAKIEIE